MTGLSDEGAPRSRGRWNRGGLLHGLAPLTVGLTLTATALAGACTWQARDASQGARESAQEVALSQAYTDINSAANREYSAQLRYLSTDGRSVATGASSTQIAPFAQAQSDLHAAVDRVKSLGSVDDKALATFVLVEDRQYSVNARTTFAAEESGQIATAQHLATTITGPRVDILLSRVASAASLHARRSQESMTRLTERSHLAAIAIPASFGLALLLLGVCWVILLQLNRAVRYQSAALLAEKQLLSTVIESSPYFVYWKDRAGNYLGANRAFEQLTSDGRPLPAATGRQDPRSGTEPQSEADSKALIRRLIELEEQVQAAGVAALDQQAMVRSAAGEERRLLFSVLPRRAPEGSEGVIGVGVDVTRLTDLERHLATASRLESVGRLAAGLAHEINTPVQVLSFNAQFISDAVEQLLSGLRALHVLGSGQEVDAASIRAVIERTDLDFLQSEVPKALADSREGLQRVARIVQATKEFARGGEGRRSCQLNDAVQSVVEISRHEWTAVADLQLSLDPELETVVCHEGEIKESILAMVMNAAHAVASKVGEHPGSPRGVIEVRTHNVPGAVRIVVRDTGIGMDDAVRGKVFDPFFTTKDVGEGSGQGLNFAYGAIVIHHGGSIEVTSTPGEGSVFTITLPTRPRSPEGCESSGVAPVE